MKEYLTACPRNCYSTCSFKVIVENNKIVKLLPDPDNVVTPEGPCIKGLSYLERSDSLKRLRKPLLKSANGSFTEISYSKAINIIVDKLKPILNSKKQKSVLYYTGSGMSGLTNEIGFNFFKIFGGATTTYGNFCWPAGLEAVRLTLGEVKHNAPWDIENAKLVIAWGKNPAETNIQETVFIDRARKKGAKFIVVDPRRTPTADKSDLLICPKPGTDAALALAIAKILIEEDLIDRSFIKKYVSGFEEFSKSLTISPEEAEGITGIPASDIINFARLIGKTSALTIIPGFGMQRYTNGGQTVRSLLALNILTGNIGKPGCSFNYANLQGYVFDATKEPLSYYPHINPDPDFRRIISMARLGDDLLNCPEPGIEFAWFERGNPVTQAPDTNKVVQALKNIDFKVVVDQFLTDTAQEADIILPSKNMFEQQDIISSYWSPYVHYRPKVLEPPEDVKPESEIFYELAKALGFEFNEDQIPDPGNDSIDNWLENRIHGITSLTLADLKREKVIAPGYQECAYSDYMFQTPTEKIQLIAEEAGTLWKSDPLPGFVNPYKENNTEKGEYIFLSPNTKNRIHSQFGNLDVISMNDPEPKLQINTEDARELGLAQDDKVRVHNSRGEIVVKVDIGYNIIKGVVSMPNGWWLKEMGGGNLLSLGRETDMGHGTAFHDNLVSIEKLSDERI